MSLFNRWLNPPQTSAVPPSVPEGIRVHTCTVPGTKGCSLQGIADMYLGDRRRWVDLYNINRNGVLRRDGTFGFMANVDDLREGDKVYMP